MAEFRETLWDIQKELNRIKASLSILDSFLSDCLDAVDEELD